MGDRVLVVDDDLSILRVVAANLRARGYEALTAASGTVALTVIETQQPDCIVLDLGLPDIDGLEVLRRLRTWTTTPVVDPHRRRRRARQGHSVGSVPTTTSPSRSRWPSCWPGFAGRYGMANPPRTSTSRDASRPARSVSTLTPARSPGGGNRYD